MKPGQRLLLIFAVAILAPGLILGFFSVRALVQEGLFLDRQIQQSLDSAAEKVGRRLESELSDWQAAAGSVARSSADPALWPERVRRAIASPGSAVVLTGDRDHLQAHPAGSLLYELNTQVSFDRPSLPWLARAESLEFHDQRHDEAIALYRRLLPDAKPPERAAILRGLAASLRNAGRHDEALRTYELLADEPSVRMGSVTSDLLALYEIALASPEETRVNRATRLYRGLIDGRWGLQKENYEFYADAVHQWLLQSESVRQLADEEQHKLTLTRAAESFVRRPDSLLVDGDEPLAVAFWSSDPFAAVIVRDLFTSDYIAGATESPDVVAAVTTPGGQPLAGPPPRSGVPSSTYAIRNAALPLRVSVSSRDPAAISAGVRRQQMLYAGVVAIVVALLAFGGLFTMRTLRTELAVAQMKSDFVSTVSHEFRSPLTGINQLAEMLRDGRVDDETRRREYYEMIVTETRRLRRLVENVLDFARMEDGRKQYRFEPLETAPWLRGVANDFEVQITAAGFEVDASIPTELPTILADRDTLTTAVQNLLDNAVKYSPTTKCIRIAAATDRAGLSISVADRGVGIAEADRPRIFEKFYRGSGDLARQVKGVGLGLNLVHHIVAAHGGTVAFESTVGAGSTFTIRLNAEGPPERRTRR